MSEIPVIASDSGIPWAEVAFGKYGRVMLLDPREMSPRSLRHADVLVVRSVVPVGKDLLETTRVRLVCSATAGTDHVDERWLETNGVRFAHAPGANADSVADYVVAAVLALEKRSRTPLCERSSACRWWVQVSSVVTLRGLVQEIRRTGHRSTICSAARTSCLYTRRSAGPGPTPPGTC